MNIPTSLEKAIQHRVATGKYRNVGEVMRRALAALEEHERLVEAIRKKNTEAYSEYKRGESLDGEEVLARLETRAKSRSRRLAP